MLSQAAKTHNRRKRCDINFRWRRVRKLCSRSNWRKWIFFFSEITQSPTLKVRLVAPKIIPWVPEVFLAYGGNFRCWPKADTSSAVGRSHERRSHYKDLTETGNRTRKVSGTQGTKVTFRVFSVEYTWHFSPTLFFKRQFGPHMITCPPWIFW